MPGSGGVSFASVRRGLGWAALLPLCFALTGCFLLDYTGWAQAKASQKRVAAQRMPGHLRTEEVGTVLPNRDTPQAHVERLRIRAYATPHLRGGSSRRSGAVRASLERRQPDVSTRFFVSARAHRVSHLAAPGPDDDLGELLKALERDDPGSDVDWVVILASPRHMVAASPDQIGLAPMLGHHLALRAMSDADEFDAIEDGFSELSQSEKGKLYAARKRHKAATVLLHELGHTLGLPHELEWTELLRRTYLADALACRVLVAGRSSGAWTAAHFLQFIPSSQFTLPSPLGG